MATISKSDMTYLAAVFSVMDGVPDVDYQKVADLVGTKYAKNAKARVKIILDKVKGGATIAKDAAGGSPAKSKAGGKPTASKVTKARATKPKAKNVSAKQEAKLEALAGNAVSSDDKDGDAGGSDADQAHADEDDELADEDDELADEDDELADDELYYDA
ncbi:hypothetical protein BP6252_00121 [Coleophoma cylindrospora]|uniref:Uncharacterized protein n=1 Tax=Coleophoma cylindrospora TaxID=1849047 RepID=A0A3D8SP33_9HELO|nr:hypothetical protein BP6252_00121 [Coleophoma cylindrospora]